MTFDPGRYPQPPHAAAPLTVASGRRKPWAVEAQLELYEEPQAAPLPDGGHTLIDLFAGAGGLSAGFSRLMGHSFHSVWANDFEPDAARSYRANFGHHCADGDQGVPTCK